MTSIRDSYEVFPWWTSRFWTWLTGRPASGQQPLFELTPTLYAVSAVTTYMAGFALAALSFKLQRGWFFPGLLCGWVLTVNGSRRMISTIAHQCIHGRFSGLERHDRFVADLFAILTLTQSAKDYREEHSHLHHRHSVFTSRKDPAGEFLWRAGFKPGMTVYSLWLSLLITLISPRFHCSFLRNRFASLARSLPMPVKAIAGLGWFTVLAGALLICPLHVLVLGLLFPIIVLYQISVLLEFISEHAWFVLAGSLDHPKYIHATHSWGRFCGRRTPRRDGEHALCYVVSWLAWGVEHAVYHLPVRLFVLPGDLSQHDFHHRMPATLQWTVATYAREDDLRSRDSRWPPYREFWGLHNAIAHVFNGIANAVVHDDVTYPENEALRDKTDIR